MVGFSPTRPSTINTPASALFMIIIISLGGDGLAGKVENGHYFLGNHGQYTEASPILYHFTRLHAIATMALHPFLILCAMIFGSIR